jgi:hypothetical protein
LCTTTQEDVGHGFANAAGATKNDHAFAAQVHAWLVHIRSLRADTKHFVGQDQINGIRDFDVFFAALDNAYARIGVAGQKDAAVVCELLELLLAQGPVARDQIFVAESLWRLAAQQVFAFRYAFNEPIPLSNDGVSRGDGHIHRLEFFQGFHHIRQGSTIQKWPGSVVDHDVVGCVVGQGFETFEGRSLAADTACDNLHQRVVLKHARHFVHIGKRRSDHNPNQREVLSQRAQAVFKDGFARDAYKLFGLVSRHAAA